MAGITSAIEGPIAARPQQRARLRRAMVELVARHGFAGVRARSLCEQAKVSSRDLYRCYSGIHDCFLATYDEIVRIASERVLAGLGDPHEDWQGRLWRAYLSLAEVVAQEPDAARLALVEAIAAGPQALVRMRETGLAFEWLLRAVFNSAQDGVGELPVIESGIVAGVTRVMRARLLAGRQHELAGLIDELDEWAMPLRCAQAAAVLRLHERHPAALQAAPPRPRASSWTRALGSDRAAILHTVARLAATNGFAQLTPPQVRREAMVSHAGFRRHFEGCEQSLLEALRWMTADALAQAEIAATGANGWARGVHRALNTMIGCLTGDEVFARIACVEVFAIGPRGLVTREELIGALAEQLRQSAPPSLRPRLLAAEASVGAIWGIVHRHLVGGQAYELAEIAPMLSFIALAPAIGPQEAHRAIRAEHVAAGA